MEVINCQKKAPLEAGRVKLDCLCVRDYFQPSKIANRADESIVIVPSGISREAIAGSKFGTDEDLASGFDLGKFATSASWVFAAKNNNSFVSVVAGNGEEFRVTTVNYTF